MDVEVLPVRAFGTSCVGGSSRLFESRGTIRFLFGPIPSA